MTTLRTNNEYNPNLLSEINKHPFDAFIRFRESDHRYWIKDDDKDLTSCTTFIHHFFGDFDSDKVIKQIMQSDKYKNDPEYAYYQMEAKDIKHQWSESGRIASEAGTRMHASIEYFYNGLDVEDISVEFQQFLEFQKDHTHLKAYRTEFMVFSEVLKITGSIDMLFRNEDGTITIADWKRSKKSVMTHMVIKRGNFHLNIYRIVIIIIIHYN